MFKAEDSLSPILLFDPHFSALPLCGSIHPGFKQAPFYLIFERREWGQVGGENCFLNSIQRVLLLPQQTKLLRNCPRSVCPRPLPQEHTHCSRPSSRRSNRCPWCWRPLPRPAESPASRTGRAWLRPASAHLPWASLRCLCRKDSGSSGWRPSFSLQTAF